MSCFRAGSSALRVNKRGLGLLVVVSLILGVGRACIVRPASSFPGAHFNRGKNAIWLGIEWVNQPHSEAEIATLADTLARHQIRYVLAYVSYLRPGGSFGATYPYAGSFLRAIHRAQPDLKVLAWIGIPLDNVDLRQLEIRRKIVSFCVGLSEFDGIHLDPEPIGNADPGLLSLLDETRQAIGSTPILSLAARAIWPVFPEAPWPLNVMWSGGFYREIARRVDQIAVMTYDSSLPLSVLYRLWSRFQVIGISRALAETAGQKTLELFFGVSTSEERTATHQPEAENMVSSLSGIVDGLNDDESRPAVVTGVAIYPEWETDAAEWQSYESLWLGLPTR